MKPRTVSLGLLAVGLLAAAPAQAATLTTDRQAVTRRTETVTLTGAGFTPNGAVRLTLDGAQVARSRRPRGLDRRRGPAPVIDPSRQRRFSLVATDVTNPALTATATPFATVLDVDVTPDGGSKTRVRKITARGFTRGKTLYLHIRHRRYKRNIRLGALKAPCGTKIVRKRLFSRRAPAGVYTAAVRRAAQVLQQHRPPRHLLPDHHDNHRAPQELTGRFRAAGLGRSALAG